jgi:PKD repeat protein
MFSDLSTGDATSWSWDFGDTGTSTEQNPTHVYSTSGSYTVSLTVTGPGGTDSETKTSYIQVSAAAPVANFSANQTSGLAPLSVVFSDQSTGEVTSWSWNFGDTGTSTEQNPTHVYSTSGAYTVSLTVTGPGGADGETKVGYVVVSVPVPPTADFSATPTSGAAPLTVVFSDLSTGDVTSWSWDFGDTGTSTEQNPTYVYANPGTYSVMLTATGPGGGDSETKTGYVSVSATVGPFEPVSLDVVAGGNGVLEPGEVARLEPAWWRTSGSSLLSGVLTLSGPGAPDPSYSVLDGLASYGTVGTSGTGCASATGDCYSIQISVPASRPSGHWDAVAQETLSNGQIKSWIVHVGGSFDDVPATNPFYRQVETLLHHSVTAGCSATEYCPKQTTTRAQMAVFVLKAKEGPSYRPPACGDSPVFGDVPASSPYCPWVEELARRNVVQGCGGGNYCPDAAVTRRQMAVFVLKTEDPGVTPSSCTTPVFGDVPASSPFCRWVEELAARGVVVGCGGGDYCPAAPVTREQMGVFISKGFELSLYGP